MDYPELIAELVDRTGDSTIPTRAKMFLSMAEAAINKVLRVAGNEAEEILTTDSTSKAALPPGFLAVREVLNGTCVMEQVVVSDLPYRTSAYAIEGGNVVTHGPDIALTFRYYAAVTPLDETGTNWLIESDPEIYLYSMLYQAFMSKLDAEKARAARVIFDDLISAKQRSDMIARLARKPFRVQEGVV